MGSTICFFSSLGYTGGPLAIHQAALTVNQLGGDASVVYIKRKKSGWSVSRQNDSIIDKLSLIKRLKVDPRLKRMKLDKKRIFELDTHFIVPEGRPDLAIYLLGLGCSNVSIWWLSVDNFPLSRLNHLDIQNMMHSCSHLCQSHYAVSFLSSTPAKKIRMLSDFTEFDDTSLIKPTSRRSYDIAFLPAKAAGAGAILKDLSSEFKLVALEKMDRATMCRTLGDTKIFLDFGHHPGKDRVPREAALAGVVPLIRYAGAAKEFADVPLGEQFFIKNEDFFIPGKVLEKCRECLKNIEKYQSELNEYQTFISKEKEIFFNEISNLIEI